MLNNIQFFNNDDAGNDMLLQLQQRAESWAASGEWCHSSESANANGYIDRYINTCDELVSFRSPCRRLYADFHMLGMISGRIPSFVRPFRKRR